MLKMKPKQTENKMNAQHESDDMFFSLHSIKSMFSCTLFGLKEIIFLLLQI